LAGLALAVLVIPQGRAIAQEVWFRLFLNRVDVIRVDLSELPFETKVAGSGQRLVMGVEGAEAQAGFRPSLPPVKVWPGAPSLKVIDTMTVEQAVRTKELRAALERAGASDVVVPDEWNEVTVRASIGPIVEANYAGEIQILQSKPAKVFLPAGLQLEQFAETAFPKCWFVLAGSPRRCTALRAAAITTPWHSRGGGGENRGGAASIGFWTLGRGIR
jgi:hypothetical protein